MMADITIFDPQGIHESTSMKLGEQCLPSSGTPYVLVGGTVVVRDSKVDVSAAPGQAIRHPVS